MNQQEIDKLRNDLKGMNFGKAKAKVRGLDPKGRLAYYRNVQATASRLYTRYELPGQGINVTLIEQETESPIKNSANLKAEYELVDVLVQPTSENKV